MPSTQKIHVRTAIPADIHTLAVIASEGFATSPVFKFVRTKADVYREDTIRSYERQYALFMADPSIHFECVLLEIDPVEHVTAPQRQFEKVTRVWKKGIRSSQKQRIIGFAIWQLQPGSGKLNKSLLKQLKFTYSSFMDKLTSIFWKSRDSDQGRAAKIRQMCRDAQRFTSIRGMELEQMVIHPEFQQNGFGTLLGKRGLEIAEEEKCPIFVIATPMGERLYEKLGFRKIGDVEAHDGKAECRLAVQEWEPTLSN